MPRCPQRLAAALLTALLATAGCGSNQQHSPTAGSAQTPTTGPVQPSTPDPCKLVTVAEVSAVLGGQSNEGKSEPGGLPGQRTCTFATTGHGFATVGLAPGDKNLFDQIKVQMGPTARTVDGLGAGAFRDAGSLTAHSGDWVVFIFVNGKNNDAEYEAACTALAKATLSRL